MKKIFRNKEEKQGIVCCLWCMYSGLGYVFSASKYLDVPMILFAIDWVMFLSLMIIYYIESDRLYRKNIYLKTM